VTVDAAQAKSMIADKTEVWFCMSPDDENTFQPRAPIMAATRKRPETPTLPDAPNTKIEEWLADTGCGYDLVDRSEISVKDAYLEEAAEKVIFDRHLRQFIEFMLFGTLLSSMSNQVLGNSWIFGIIERSCSPSVTWIDVNAVLYQILYHIEISRTRS
jgi:hypothetical protein